MVMECDLYKLIVSTNNHSDILEEYKKNFNLTIRFMGENAIFLNITVQSEIKNLLTRSYKLLYNLIINRPPLYSYINKYKGNCPDSYGNQGQINLRKYFTSFKQNKQSPSFMRRDMLRRIEYGAMRYNMHNGDPETSYAIKKNRRNKGILKRAHRDLLYNYDKKIIDSHLLKNTNS